MQECSIDGCERPVKTKGYCMGHYHRYIRHGDPLHGRKLMRGDAKQFILDNADHDGDECLIWPYGRSAKHGYAEIRKEHFGTGLAHRAMCFVAHGQPPSPLHEAAHSCGKGHDACINPKHLSWKTPTENNRDKQGHGTQPWGERMWHMAKLTREQAVRIKYGTENVDELAKEMRVTKTTITRIRSGFTWRGI